MVRVFGLGEKGGIPNFGEGMGCAAWRSGSGVMVWKLIELEQWTSLGAQASFYMPNFPFGDRTRLME